MAEKLEGATLMRMDADTREETARAGGPCVEEPRVREEAIGEPASGKPTTAEPAGGATIFKCSGGGGANSVSVGATIEL